MVEFTEKTIEVLNSHPNLKATLLDAIKISSDTKYSLRFSFCAMSFREALRIFFEKKAPNEEIQKCHWWTPQLQGPHKCSVCGAITDCIPIANKTGISRKDRLHFYVFKYVSDNSIFNGNKIDEIDSLFIEYRNSVNDLSKFVHDIHIEVLEEKFNEKIDGIIMILNDLIPKIDAAPKQAEYQLKITLDNTLNEVFFENLFCEVDCLATHAIYDSVWIHKIIVTGMDEKYVYFSGEGTVNYEFEYDRDCSSSQGFPFTFKGTMSTDNLKNIVVEPEDVFVDTSSWSE